MLQSDSARDSTLSAQIPYSRGGIFSGPVAGKLRESPPESSAWVTPSAQPPCC